MNLSIHNDETYTEKTFTKVDQPDCIIESCIFDACKFELCNFSNTQFVGCKFTDCEFIESNLSSINIDRSLFVNVLFDQCKMIGINWTSVAWPQIKLCSPIKCYHCNLSDSSFFALKLDEITLESCKAHRVDFRETDLSESSFIDTDFEGAIFTHTKLVSADFNGAYNYSIDIELNNIKKAKFSFPEVISLLDSLDIEVSGL